MSMGSTVVEYSPHHPKGEGSSPPIAAGTGRENGTKKVEIESRMESFFF